MKDCQDTFCEKKANPGFIYCTEHLHKAMTENKNEWETIATGPIEHIHACTGPSGYYSNAAWDYELRRRKKEKVMPPITKGMGAFINLPYGKMSVVIMGFNHEGDKYTGKNLEGFTYDFDAIQVLKLYEDGLQIWRREG